ncbi:putative membrane protein [Sinorhizobium medicae]
MSLSRLVWTMTRILRRLWVRASLYCLVAIATALAAIWIGPILPAAFPSKVGAKAVDAILSIIASSMLAVTTFSLSTLVAATSAAASSATPRATSLLLEDATSQRALSTFLGAFLFSLVGLIALNTELYDDGGRFVLFVATLGLVAIIVVTLLRWIDHLAGLGHMGETIGRVEKAATEAYRAHTHAPFLGGTPAETVPEGAIAIRHKRIGYVQHLDMGALSTVADEADGATST